MSPFTVNYGYYNHKSTILVMSVGPAIINGKLGGRYIINLLER